MSRVAQRRIGKELERPEWPPGAVIGGVDTHKHVHVAAVCDPLGRVLGTAEFTTTTAGFKALLRFLRKHGQLAAVGIEGPGCWGGGLARFLAARDVTVIEVDRPNRQARRRRGKSDTIDAEEAARSVIAGRARTTPKTGTGPVEMARQLRVARRSAIKQRTQALLQLQALADTAPDELRDAIKPLRYAQLIELAARFRPGDMDHPHCGRQVRHERSGPPHPAPGHRDRGPGRPPQDHPHRRPSAAARRARSRPGHRRRAGGRGRGQPRTADQRAVLRRPLRRLKGQASSGNTRRHRLNRGGDREANSALWRIVLVRMKTHPPTRAYVTRRTSEGMSKREIMRCLKRYVAREIYHHLNPTPPAARHLRLVLPAALSTA